MRRLTECWLDELYQKGEMSSDNSEENDKSDDVSESESGEDIEKGEESSCMTAASDEEASGEDESMVYG